jgi:thiamine-phosphate pyrophosphorylase
MLSRLRSGIYLITPDRITGLAGLARAAIAGGAGMIQLRLKECGTREFIAAAQALLGPCRAACVPLIINDRADVCLAVGAHGVHVGQEDMPVAEARRILGPQRIVGATTQTPDLARQAEAEGASYVAVGPMAASPTKPGKPPIGPAAIPPVKRAVSIPVCAIGGIAESNIGEVAQAGADLFAVVSAIAGADDPTAATRRLIEAAKGSQP